MLDRRVRSGVDQALASVGVTNQVRRLARRSPHLDDLGRLVGDADSPAVHMQPVTNRCAAWEPPFQGRV